MLILLLQLERMNVVVRDSDRPVAPYDRICVFLLLICDLLSGVWNFLERGFHTEGIKEGSGGIKHSALAFCREPLLPTMLRHCHFS